MAPCDIGPTPVRARFELSAGPMSQGAIPWPDDLYLGADGHVQVRSLDGPFGDALAEGYAQLDGFAARPVVTFEFDAPLDPRSLPQTPKDTLAARAAVFL